MKLTYDVLLHIISLYSCASEAVPLVATCRVLRHEGAKIALRKPVTIIGRARLASFLKFLRAENSSRCWHLKQLELRRIHAEGKLVRRLLETLPLLVNVQNLRLAHAEELLASHPALPTAFAVLPSLRHLSVSEVERATCAFLSSLRAPIVSIVVDFITDDQYDTAALWDHLTPAQWPSYHPTTLLANVAPTLEELQCVAWSTDPDWDAAINPSEKVYPNVRRLSIATHELPLRTDPFIRAFPNLTHLNANTEDFLWDADITFQDLRTSHEVNVGKQLSSRKTWTRLEHFTGGLIDLYAIGLTCRINRITIADGVDHELSLDMLSTALQYTRPLHLKLRKGVAFSQLEGSEPNFISVLRSEGAPDLVNLDLCIYFEEEDQDKDWKIAVDNLASALTGLRLKFLALRFDTPDFDPTPAESRAFEQLSLRFKSDSKPLRPGSLSPDSLDMDVLVARLESMPSLEAALIVLPGPGSGGENIERTITKGTSRLARHEQWRSWLHGKERFVI